MNKDVILVICTTILLICIINGAIQLKTDPLNRYNVELDLMPSHTK